MLFLASYFLWIMNALQRVPAGVNRDSQGAAAEQVFFEPRFVGNVFRTILLFDWDHPSVPTCTRCCHRAQRQSRMNRSWRPPRRRRAASLTDASTAECLRVSGTSLNCTGLIFDFHFEFSH